MAERRLWLDDVRPAPEGWDRRRTAAGTIEVLGVRDYDVISLDHDLGMMDGTLYAAPSGYDVLVWLEEQIATGSWGDRPVPEIRVHSANPSGKDRMLFVVEKIRQMTEADDG